MAHLSSRSLRSIRIFYVAWLLLDSTSMLRYQLMIGSYVYFYHFDAFNCMSRTLIILIYAVYHTLRHRFSTFSIQFITEYILLMYRIVVAVWEGLANL